jgi:hypothetical protein
VDGNVCRIITVKPVEIADWNLFIKYSLDIIITTICPNPVILGLPCIIVVESMTGHNFGHVRKFL